MASQHRQAFAGAAWLVALVAVCPPPAVAITMQDPAHFTVARIFTPAVPRPIGGLRFSADGNTVYVVGATDSNASALYRMTVVRSPTTQEVTGFGSPVKVFDGSNPDSTEPEAGLDAGLEFGPSGTFFYSYYPTKFIAERPGGVGGAQNAVALTGLVSVAGLTFSPTRIDPGTSFGRLQVSTGVAESLFEVPLVAGTVAGTFVPNPSSPITLFARVFRAGPPRVGGRQVAGIQYVPAGTFGGDLMYASFFDKELWSVRIDDATGLPVGGTNAPIEDLFATGFTAPPLGLEFDPISPNELFVSTWDDVVAANNQILQIKGFASTAPTTTTTTTTSTSTSTSRPTTSSTSSSTTTSRPTTSSTSTSTSRPTTTSSSTTTTRPTTSSTSTSSSSTTSTSRPTTSTSSASSTSTSTTTTRPTTSSTGASSTSTSRPTTSTTSSPASTSTSTSRPTSSTAAPTTSTSSSTSTSTSRPTTSTSASTSTSTSRPTTSSSTSTSTSTSPVTTTTLAVVTIRTSSLMMRDLTGPPAVPARRRFTFQSRTGSDPSDHAVLVPGGRGTGDPTIAGGVIDVYNASGSGEHVQIALPAGGWVPYGDPAAPVGYRFSAPSRSAPIARVTVRANRLRIRGGGAAFAYTLDESAQGSIAVRLRLGTTRAWCAVAVAKTSGSPPSTASYDHVDRFVAAHNTPPPAICPAVP